MQLGFHGEARAEFSAAAEWYEAERPGLGGEFLDEVAKAIKAISAHPDSWPPAGPRSRRASARRFIVPRFPYLLIYSAHGDEILVVAVAQAKRKPGYWRRRLR